VAGKKAKKKKAAQKRAGKKKSKKTTLPEYPDNRHIAKMSK